MAVTTAGVHPQRGEAQATDYLVDYNGNHPFRKAGKRIQAYRAVTPWLYGRAFSAPGTTAIQFIDNPPPALARPKKARVVLYRDASRGSAPERIRVVFDQRRELDAAGYR
ncbi:MAG: hypothetical protein R3E66_03040 [bacterium]